MRFDTVLFDLDGTLTQSGEGIEKSVAHALRTLGYPVPPEERLREFVGPPLYESLLKIARVREEDVSRAIEVFRERFREVGWRENRVYPGIPDLLSGIARSGGHSIIVTGKPEPLAQKVARYFGLDRLLDGLVGTRYDERRSDKEHLIARALEGRNPGRVAMVGDRRFDIEAARRRGFFTIGVTYGYGSREELEQAGADQIVETPQALREFLEVPLPRGRFLTFEGTDGSGKTTQLNRLRARLEEMGYSLVFTREPGGCPISERIRQVVLDIGSLGMSDECEALLFAAARAEHVRSIILPALAAGKIVLCDRFLDSSIAYQAYGRELGEDLIRQINAPAVGRLKPDLTVLLLTDAATALGRQRAAHASDRMEVEKAQYFDRVLAGYRRLSEQEPDRFRVIDAAGSIDTVYSAVEAAVLDFLH